MDIIPFSSHHLSDVTRLINAFIASMLPGWQLSEKQVAAILRRDLVWGIHFEGDDPQPWRWERETVCVVEGQSVLAAARYDVRFDDGADIPALVGARWLVGQPERPDALQHLIDHLLEFKKTGKTAVMVGSRFDFGLGWGGVPVSATHVSEQLQRNGFTPNQKWVVMTTALIPSMHDSLPDLAPFTLRWKLDDEHLEWTVELYDGETLAGECQSWGIPMEFAECSGYSEWMEIEWLGVEDAYRRRGFGRRLLQEQMRFHTARGIRHLMLYVETNNAPARAVYESLGFGYGLECWVWGR